MGKIKYGTGFEEGVIYNGSLWAVAVNYPWLCRINLSDFNVELISKIPDTDAIVFSYKVIALEGSKLVLMPVVADHIFEYDIQNNQFEKIELKYSLKTTGTVGGATFKFRSATKCEDVIWMMPQASLSITEYRIETKEVVEHTKWYEELPELHNTEQALFGMGIMVKDSLWLPCLHINAVLEFSMKTKAANLHYIGNRNMRFETIAYANENFWLLDNAGRILYAWDGKGEIQVAGRLPEDYIFDAFFAEYDRTKNSGVFYMHAIEEQLLLMPLLTNQFLLFDTNTRRYIKISDKTDGVAYCSGVYFIEDQWICISQTGNEMIAFSFESEEVLKKQLYVYVDIEELLRFDSYLEKDVTLSEFINTLGNEGTVKKQKELPTGALIYENMIADK